MNIIEAIKTLKAQCNGLSTYGANPVLKQAIEVLIDGYEKKEKEIGDKKEEITNLFGIIKLIANSCNQLIEYSKTAEQEQLLKPYESE